MKKLLFLISFGWTFLTWGQSDIDALLRVSNRHSIPYISVTETRMLQLNQEVILLDARETDEFKVSHLEGAIHIGHDKFSDENLKTGEYSKDKTIVVYCSVGIRSENIGEKLKKLGYENVKNLYGGIFKWFDSDFPVVDEQGNETQRVHTFSNYWGFFLNKGIKVN